MISIRASVAELDRQAEAAERNEESIRACLAGWRGSLQGVADAVFPLHATAAQSAVTEWRAILAALAPGLPAERIPRETGRVLTEFAKRVRREQASELESMKSLLDALAGAASGFRERNDGYGAQFQSVGESLAELSRVDNLEALRLRLTKEAARLGDAVAGMIRENREAIEAVESELSTFRHRLAEAEAAASTDALTGLSNRRELERQLQARIEGNELFCLILFDLDGFKSVNDRFGHACGDQVLLAFSRKVRSQLRSGDFAARWGGDEFMVLLRGPLVDGLRRSRQMAKQLAVRYEIESDGRTLQIPMRASAGVVEHRRGEGAAELFQRADQAMYAAKNAGGGREPPLE